MNQEKILIFSDLLTPHDFRIIREINVTFQTVFFDGISRDRREEQGRETGQGLEKSREHGGQMIHAYQTSVEQSKDRFIHRGEKASEGFFPRNPKCPPRKYGNYRIRRDRGDPGTGSG